MRKLKIGVLDTSTPNLDVKRLALSYGALTIIASEEKRGDIDVLLIPNNIGAYINMRCFLKDDSAVYSIKGYCPIAERFRISDRGLDYYISRDIPIIGIGDGMTMLWDKIGSYATISETGEIILLKDNTIANVLASDHRKVLEWNSGNFYGVVSIENKLLHNLLSEMKKALVRDLQYIEESKQKENKGEELKFM